MILIALDLYVQLLDPHLFCLLGLWLGFGRSIDLDAVGLLYVFALLDLVIHLFELLLQLFLFLILSILLTFFVISRLGCRTSFLAVFLLAQSQISKLAKDPNVLELFVVTD